MFPPPDRKGEPLSINGDCLWEWILRPDVLTPVSVAGIELDPNTTSFHLRWTLPEALREHATPPLTANRVMGALGSIVASRVAREFRLGGPSYTISSEETSGTHALDVALRALAAGELDRAVVGAVDLTSDVRSVLARRAAHTSEPVGVPGDAAVALVLKRLDDARRDDDLIYAVLCGSARASGAPAGTLGPADDTIYEALTEACLMVRLERSAGATYHDRLWIDRNRDGSFDGDELLTTKPREQRHKWWSSFRTTVSIPVPGDEKNPLRPYPLSLWFVVDPREPTSEPALRWSRRGWHQGEVTLQGETVPG